MPSGGSQPVQATPEWMPFGFGQKVSNHLQVAQSLPARFNYCDLPHSEFLEPDLNGPDEDILPPTAQYEWLPPDDQHSFPHRALCSGRNDCYDATSGDRRMGSLHYSFIYSVHCLLRFIEFPCRGSLKTPCCAVGRLHQITCHWR